MEVEAWKVLPVDTARMGASRMHAAERSGDKKPPRPAESPGMRHAMGKGTDGAPVYCDAHLERAGRRVPAADSSLRLCRACLRGRPIHPSEEFGYEGSERDAARRRYYYLRYRPKILARMRRARQAAGA